MFKPDVTHQTPDPESALRLVFSFSTLWNKSSIYKYATKHQFHFIINFTIQIYILTVLRSYSYSIPPL